MYLQQRQDARIQAEKEQKRQQEEEEARVQAEKEKKRKREQGNEQKRKQQEDAKKAKEKGKARAISEDDSDSLPEVLRELLHEEEKRRAESQHYFREGVSYLLCLLCK